jgi:fused signal recognition particle receptor
MVLNFLKSSYEKVKGALAKTRQHFGQKLNNLFARGLSDETLEEIEKTLYEADLGVSTVREILSDLETKWRLNPKATSEECMDLIKLKLIEILGEDQPILAEASTKEPTVILVVGVNGSGKTTTIAKLAHYAMLQEKKVLIAAADTFRAAAVEQLGHWANLLGCEIVKGNYGSDPAAVTFDAVAAAKARNKDLLFIDTAGRLQNKTHLMQELEKIKRTISKQISRAPHEILLVMDANSGQNGIDQARWFHQYAQVTGIVLTKLDGSAKGGIVIAIRKQLHLPIKFIGLGEGMEDLKPFNREIFVDALLGRN